MTAFLAILLAGVGTYAMRAVFIVVLARRKFPPLALRVLEYVAPAVMGALVMSMLITPEGTVVLGAPELGGLGAAALVAAKTRNHIYALVVAMSVFWLIGYTVA